MADSKDELSRVESLMEGANFIEALKILNQFDEIEKLSPHERVLWYILKSRCLNRLGKPEYALKLTEEVYKESQRLGDPIKIFDLLIEIAEAFSGLWRVDEFWNIFTEIESQFKKISQKPSKDFKRRLASVLSMRSINHRERMEFNKAIECAEQKHKLEEELGNKHEIARSLFLIGISSWSKGELDRSLDYFQKSLELEGAGFNQNIHFCLGIIGSIYGVKGEFKKCIDYIRRSLSLAEELNSKTCLAYSYLCLGNDYCKMGDLGLAQENLEKSISIIEDSNEDYSFFGPYHVATSTMIEVAVDKGDLGLAQQYLERLKVLKSSGKIQSSYIYNFYPINKAMVMKRSPYVRQRNKAEEILKQVLKEQEHFAIRMYALLNLIDCLLIKLENTGELEIYEEIQTYISSLLDLSEKMNSYSLLAETLLLQGKLALLVLDTTRARQYLTKAQEIAEKYGFKRLAMHTSNEHDILLKTMNLWEELKDSKAPLAERLKLSRFNDELGRMLRKQAVKPKKLQSEMPVLLNIMTQQGDILLSSPFTADMTIDNARFGEFLAAFNTYSDQIFSEAFDRVKFGQYTVLIKPVNGFSVCYMFQGQTYSAKQKLTHFSEVLNKDSNIMEILKNADKKSEIIKANENPAVEQLITESFLSDPEAFQLPFKAYSGDEPFVFASYAHTDKLQVYPIIDYLDKIGVKVWYDEGIPASENWKKSIVENIERCGAFLVFITPHIIDSEYVRKEISFALRKKKPFFSVYLKETKLPSELEFEIADIQSIMKYLMPEPEFYNKLKETLYPV
ncbi:MAG: TIR domain-containing protein, partial [Candidatus Hodarchaeota archaeon]